MYVYSRLRFKAGARQENLMPTLHYNTMTYVDKTNEVSSVTIYNDAITAASLPGYLTQLGALRTATDAITLGGRVRGTWVGDADETLVDPSTLPNQAQRENKLLVVYENATTNKRFQLTIPTLDLSIVTFVPGGKDAILMTTPEIAAWITAFEAIASPPDDPAAGVNVLEMRFVGRNS
jgi:hypothetical protein